MKLPQYCLASLRMKHVWVHSYKAEAEILLRAAVRLRVRNTICPAPGLNVINLEEVLEPQPDEEEVSADAPVENARRWCQCTTGTQGGISWNLNYYVSL